MKHYFSYTRSRKTERVYPLPTGTILIEDVEEILLPTVDIPVSKSSVDEGYFTPGIYRVNPYSVSGGPYPTVPNSDLRNSYSRQLKGYVLHVSSTTTGQVLAGPLQNGLQRFPLPSTSAYGQLALQKAKSKVGNAELELGETVGEYRETIKMLRNPLSNLKKFLIDDRSRNLRLLIALARKDKRGINRLLGRTGKASAETVTSTWLELRYGLRPLVMLVQDVIEYVNDRRDELFDPDKIRSARSKLEFEEVNYFDSVESVGFFNLTLKTVVRDKITAYGAIQYRQSEEDSLLDKLGLTPRFLPETAWNLTRLSFVVDWLFSIGPWLGTLRCNPSVSILGNTMGIKISREVEVSGKNFVDYIYTIPWTDTATCRRDMYTRSVNVDISMLPHFTWGRTLDLYKLLDSISLIWQFLPKRGK